MRFSRLLCALMVLVLGSLCAAHADTVDPSGFLILSKPTPVCKNFDHIMIQKEKGKWTGWLQLATSDKQRYPYKSISLRGTTFVFRTLPDSHNVSYSFVGHFIQKGVFSTTQPAGNVLVGSLSSWVGKKLTADGHVTFTYTVGD